MCFIVCFFFLSGSIFFCFFFSSRRRHTRCSRDWSSDVCSSDLRGPGRTLHPMTICHRCGQDNPVVAHFCSACGAPLQAGASRREERKVVTVLFADLVGFTQRAEKMDPEDVRASLAPYLERVRTELEHLGGTVEKFIGDAVMAVFGVPVAHEDD